MEMLVKTIVRYHCTPMQMAKIQRFNTNFWQREGTVTTLIAGVSLKWYRHWKTAFCFLQI